MIKNRITLQLSAGAGGVNSWEMTVTTKGGLLTLIEILQRSPQERGRTGKGFLVCKMAEWERVYHEFLAVHGNYMFRTTDGGQPCVSNWEHNPVSFSWGLIA